MSQRDKKRNDEEESGHELGLLFMLLAVLLVAAALFWPHNGQVTSTKLTSAEQNSVGKNNGPLPAGVLKRINEHLKDSNIKEEILKQNSEIENSSAPPIGPVDTDAVVMDEERRDTNPLILEQVNRAAKAVEDPTKNKGPRPPPTADQRINSQLAKEAWARDYEEKYREEYVRQFIENAKKNGYNVKVNKDLDVTGLMPYPVERPLRLPQSDSPPTKSESGK